MVERMHDNYITIFIIERRDELYLENTLPLTKWLQTSILKY